MTSVAAAMIVRDEARFLPGCLESLDGKVDEIVIVDTGSRDATVAIAQAAGARVFPVDWVDDFAAARNRGLAEVTADWVLYIDADERLRVPGDRPLGEAIDPHALAATVRLAPKSGYTRYREWRLFRRDDRLRFTGAIHETMVPLIEAIAAREGLPLARTTVEIDHLGYDGDQTAKHARNIPLLRRATAADPDRVYLWYHLAESLCAVGDIDEAVRTGHRGLQAARAFPSEKQHANASLIHQMLARLARERGDDPRALIADGLAAVPDDHALRLMHARALLDAGDAEPALAIAAGLLAIDPDALCDSLLAFDRRIFGELAHDLAAIAAFRLGRFDEARAHFDAAAALAPDPLPYRVKARAAEARARRTAP
jgi:glycosyltransferase involved in cell wall biosynthesis